MKSNLHLAFAIGFVSVMACAEAAEEPAIQNSSFRIVNQSQYQIRELRLHTTESYLDSPNLLSEPLEISEEYIFYGIGEWYVTVFREKYRDGPLIAISTANPVDLMSGQGIRLLVFDESFRTSEDEWLNPGSPRDGGTRQTPDASGNSTPTQDSGRPVMDASQTFMDAGTSTTSIEDAG